MLADRSIYSIEELADLMYSPRRLGYPNCVYGKAASLIHEFDDVQRLILPFISNFLDQDAVITVEIIEAYDKIFTFLPLSSALLQVIRTALQQLPATLVAPSDTSRNIAEDDFPIAYFLTRARKHPGFPLLALPGRDFILAAGSRVIPALLVACKMIPSNKTHRELLPTDIISSPEQYRKSKNNDKALVRSTKNEYGRVLIKFLYHICENYRILNYGSHELFRDEEEAELSAEESCRQRFYRAPQCICSLATPIVLKPHVLIKTILLTTEDENAYII